MASGGVIFTTIQKFLAGGGVLSDRRNIVVIADEAHRAAEVVLGIGRQVEERRFRKQHRPVLTIAATLERQALQQRDRQARDANGVYRRGLVEIGLESAGFLGDRNRQYRTGDPPGDVLHRLEQQVGNLLAGCSAPTGTSASARPGRAAATVTASTSATITGLTNGTRYYVWIRAKFSVGTTDFSTSSNCCPN